MKKQAPPKLNSLWTTPSPTDEPVEDLFDPEKPTRHYFFDGRSYKIRVTFFTTERDEQKNSISANKILSEYLAKAYNTDPDEFLKQGISENEEDLYGPKVKLTFDKYILYTKASSFDSELGTKMSLDRIVLALNAIMAKNKEFKELLNKSPIKIIING